MTPPSPVTTSLSRRLAIAIVTPVALLIITATMLGYQIIHMRSSARWVEHTVRVIGRAATAQKAIVDQETSLRGYLLTHDRRFLEPFERAQPLPVLDEIVELVKDNGPQQDRVIAARRRYQQWLEISAPATVEGADFETYRSIEAMLQRKVLMDELRATLTRINENEEQLLSERTQTEESTYRTTGIMAISLFLTLAGLLAFVSRRQLGDMAASYQDLIDRERAAKDEVDQENWVRSSQVKLADSVIGEITSAELSRRALAELVEKSGATVGAFYLATAGKLALLAGHALDPDAPRSFGLGEGLVGQAALDRKLHRVAKVPADFWKVRTASGAGQLSELVVLPCVVDTQTFAVVELGFLASPPPRALDLLERASDILGTAVRSSAYRQQLQELLEESRQQTEELQSQQEELRVANEELQQQGESLRITHAQLEERKEELETSNTLLASQRDELQRAEVALRDKAVELERTSRYKSEFLANMSHELRTPLNSTLILAKLLADNKHENLTEEQVGFAQTIGSASNDLLLLINDILDLSRIEAGHVDIHLESVALERVLDPMMRLFAPQAQQKQLRFALDSTATGELTTDLQRTQQILKNLLSNALKFTERGEVTLRVRAEGDRLRFAVEDSGIGIPPEQHDVIFEAFRQADGTTSRKFGGTGLGLSISRELARRLGGELTVASEPGRGSTFTLTLPRTATLSTNTHVPTVASSLIPPSPIVPSARAPRAPLSAPLVKDDRSTLDRRRMLLLIVEDDTTFAELIGSVAHDLEFQFVIASTAEEGIRLATTHLPNAIVLDVRLPDHVGLSVLDRLKRHSSTRHIPIHIISGEDHTSVARAMGASGYLVKPVTRDALTEAIRGLQRSISAPRRLLVVEDDAVQRSAISHLLEGPGVEIVGAGSVAEALAALAGSHFDCMVTDLTLPDGSGYDLLDQLAATDSAFPPVIVYTGRTLSADEEQRIRRYSSTIIVKGARSPERLVDEVTLFLHQVESELPPDRRRLLKQARDRETLFENRTILIVEDDVRNVFALNNVLEPKGVKIVIARNGVEALAAIDRHPEINLVLMDVMMPEMDGLAATMEIRRRGDALARVPIIALTAKAMPDDQARCLAAGANDYIAKPLDVEMLLSLIRVWMPK